MARDLIKILKSRREESRTVTIWAMFFSAISVLQPLYLGLNTAYFTTKRFNVPEENVDLFIVKLNNSIQLGYFIGILVVNIYFYLAPSFIQRLNNYFSVATSWMTVLSMSMVLLSYVIKGDEGSLTFYYYMLTLSSIVFGFNQGFVLNVGVRQMAWYAGSITLTGLIVVTYQLVFAFIFQKHGLANLHFWIIVVQVAIAIVICTLASVFWTIAYVSVDLFDEHYRSLEDPHEQMTHRLGTKQSIISSIWASKYPIIATIFGLGFVYGMYPSIVPYKLTDLKSAYQIDLMCMGSSAIASLLITVLCEFSSFGPNKNWRETRSAWIYSLILIVPFLLLPMFFIAPLHYPESTFSKWMLTNRGLMGTLAVLFIIMHSLLTAIGYSAAPMQSEREYNGVVSCFNTLITYVVIVVVLLYSQGYLMLHRLVKDGKEDMPETMSRLRLYFRWVGLSFVYGWQAFRNTFTTDIKADIMMAA